MSYNLLAGKKGIIFGALNEQSIAWRVAERAVEEGAEIILTNTAVAVRMGQLNELGEKLGAKVVPADATKEEELEVVFQEAIKSFGKVDFVLHSIGMSPNVRKGRSYDDLDYKMLQTTFDISAVSFHKMLQVAKKLDAIAEGGSVVALTYVAAQRTFVGYGDMADAKSLLESIARSFGYIYGREKGVRINTVSQSPTVTTAGSGVKGMSDLLDFAQDLSPLGNADANDCADYCITLFSDLTRKVTMQNLFNDGGFSSMGLSLDAIEVFAEGRAARQAKEIGYTLSASAGLTRRLTEALCLIHARYMILRTENLVKRYRTRTVVNHVSIQVGQGEIVGLLGPNGAGKTTTFYMTVGLVVPNEGRIFLDDEDITKYPVYQRARAGIGYLAQEASVYRRMSVEDNILSVLEFTDRTKAEQQARLEELIAEFRLEKVRTNQGNRLSGGERRRAEIARCLAIDPKFIMLDEPFAGVDPIAVQDIQSIVAQLKHKNIGILITDHNVYETLSITDRAYLLFEGKVLYEGTAEQLAENEVVREKYLGKDFQLRRRTFDVKP